MKGFKTNSYYPAVNHEIYCYHCKKFHSVDFEVTGYSLPEWHATWRCPDCGTSVEQLYAEVKKMPLTDRDFCVPHRERKIKTSISIWYTYKLHTVKHPLLFDIGFMSLCILCFFLCVPMFYVLGILAFPVLIAIGFAVLFFAPWHTGGIL